MNLQKRNGILVFGFVAGLLSLPLPWLTHRVTANFGEHAAMVSVSHFGAMDNLLGLFSTLPAWLFVCLSAIGGVTQMFDNNRWVIFPRAISWSLAALGAVGLVLITAGGLLSLLDVGFCVPNIGWIFALICVGSPLVTFVRRVEAESEFDRNLSNE